MDYIENKINSLESEIALNKEMVGFLTNVKQVAKVMANIKALEAELEEFTQMALDQLSTLSEMLVY